MIFVIGPRCIQWVATDAGRSGVCWKKSSSLPNPAAIPASKPTLTLAWSVATSTTSAPMSPGSTMSRKSLFGLVGQTRDGEGETGPVVPHQGFQAVVSTPASGSPRRRRPRDSRYRTPCGLRDHSLGVRATGVEGVRKGLGAKRASAFAARQCPFPPAPAAPRPPRRGVEQGLPSGDMHAGTLWARRRCGRSPPIESGVDHRIVVSPHPNSRWSRSSDGHRYSVAGTLAGHSPGLEFPGQLAHQNPPTCLGREDQDPLCWLLWSSAGYATLR